MHIEFEDIEIEKIEKKIKTQFSIKANTKGDTHINEVKQKRKLCPPDFKVGDVFSVGDKKYVIIDVKTKLLVFVIAKDWRKEGYSNSKEAMEDYKKKGDDDFLSYRYAYEFMLLDANPQITESQVIQEIRNKYEEKTEARKLDEKERKKDESWLKTRPEYCIKIIQGLDVDDLRQEIRWEQWEKHHSRRKFR